MEAAAVRNNGDVAGADVDALLATTQINAGHAGVADADITHAMLLAALQETKCSISEADKKKADRVFRPYRLDAQSQSQEARERARDERLFDGAPGRQRVALA